MPVADGCLDRQTYGWDRIYRTPVGSAGVQKIVLPYGAAIVRLAEEVEHWKSTNHPIRHMKLARNWCLQTSAPDRMSMLALPGVILGKGNSLIPKTGQMGLFSHSRQNF